MDEHNNWVLDALKDRNMALVGFADLFEIDSGSRMSFRYGVSIAIALRPEIVANIPNGPSMEYYNEYRKVSGELRETCDFLTEKIIEYGFQAKSLFCYKQDEEYKTPLPFKTLATRAGLGWIGKSAALITKRFGNAIRLGGVLTDMPFAVGEPVNVSFCGECMECVRHCPGGAITGKQWALRAVRDELLDAYKCKEAVVERGRALNIADGSCGICLAVCPWTQRYIKTKAL